MIPNDARAWLKESGYGEITASRPVGGGCINNGASLTTSSGQSFFLKTNSSAPADMFAREAEGLRALEVENGPRLPQVFFLGHSFLLLEDLAPAKPRGNYWLEFGRQLAHLHQHTASKFGFEHDNYIGLTPQTNPWTEDGFTFFGESRLMFQSRLAQEQGLLSSAEGRLVGKLAARLPELVPEQPASLIHGDLWAGNAISDAQGRPAIIDPAAHYGWAEAELAMTALFGSFPESFYLAYQETRPLEPGWRERFPIYNLYHLLNHLNLFGGGYLGQVTAILRRFA